jgi:hypothetical protein
MIDYQLKPCPFCGSPIDHVESLAKSFDPPRLYHEWHHRDDNCWLTDKIVAISNDKEENQIRVMARWNQRTYGGWISTAKQMPPPRGLQMKPLPKIPDDDADFTPDLGRSIIAKYQNLVEALLHEIDNEQPLWISTAKQMPPPHTKLLFRDNNGKLWQGDMCYGMHEPWFCVHPPNFSSTLVLGDVGLAVTHWMLYDDAMQRLGVIHEEAKSESDTAPPSQGGEGPQGQGTKTTQD